jgi:hypothetical protein
MHEDGSDSQPEGEPSIDNRMTTRFTKHRKSLINYIDFLLPMEPTDSPTDRLSL